MSTTLMKGTASADPRTAAPSTPWWRRSSQRISAGAASPTPMTEFHSAVVHRGLSDRSILSGRAAAQLQLVDDAFERPTHALRRRRIDRSGIDEEVEPGIVLVDDWRSFARRG